MPVKMPPLYGSLMPSSQKRWPLKKGEILKEGMLADFHSRYDSARNVLDELHAIVVETRYGVANGDVHLLDKAIDAVTDVFSQERTSIGVFIVGEGCGVTLVGIDVKEVRVTVAALEMT